MPWQHNSRLLRGTIADAMNLPVIPADKGEQPWYADGLDFTCTACGNCCTGGPGYVWVSDDEIEAAAGYLKMSVREFRKTYCRKVHGQVSFKEVRQPNDLHDCVFLREVPAAPGNGRELQPGEPIPQTRRVCSIYPVRPLQCRTWPFWPENLLTRKAWDRAARGCPGMNRGGRHFPLEKIVALRDAQTWPENPPTSDGTVETPNKL